MITQWKYFASIALVACSMPAMANRAQDEVAIRDAVEQINAAYTRQDAVAMAPLLAEDFETWDGIKGRERVAEAWAAEKAHYRKLEDLGIRYIADDVAIYRERGEAWSAADEKEQTPETTQYIESWVLVSRNGKWWPTAFFYHPIGD